MYSLEELGDLIEKSITNIDFPAEPKNLYEPIKYVLSNKGKRIRPIFTLTACNLFSDSVDRAIYPALAVEVFHNFTLVHDDIMDCATIRRGKETVHKKWNTNTAILSGDVMSVIAYQLLSKTSSEYLPRVIEAFNNLAIGVCEGQQYDMDFEHQKGITQEEYTRMIELKTAILLKGALQIGAIIGGANPHDIEHIGHFGTNLGLAFQHQDDLLDVYGDPTVFGKKAGGDIIANKKTVLTIKDFAKAQGKNLDTLNRMYSKTDIDPLQKVREVVDIFNEEKVNEDVEILITDYFGKALESLEKIEVSSHRKEMVKTLANSIMTRIK